MVKQESMGKKRGSFFISDILDDGIQSKDLDSQLTAQEEEVNSADFEVAENNRSPIYSPNSICNLKLTKKSRKSRTIFTDKQLQSLEESFEKQKYLSVQDRLDLAKQLKLSDMNVKTWFQNRRTKWKRQSAVGFELLNEAANCLAVQQIFQVNNSYWSSLFTAATSGLKFGGSDADFHGFHKSASIPPLAPQSFHFYPATDDNHYPTVAMPPVKSILTVGSNCVH